MGHPVRRTGARRLALRLCAALTLTATALAGVPVVPPQPVHAALIATGVPDSASVKHDRTLVWEPDGVLANDLNLLGDTIAVLNSGVSHGSLDLDPDGGFTYVPDPGFVGTDSFRYHPSGLLSTSAKVTITVTNATPVARPDSYTWAGGTLVVSAPGVLANDTDADGDDLMAELDGGGISGSFELDENGAFRFSPGGGFSGTGTVRYRVWDGVTWSATTTITLNLQPTPTPTPTPTLTPTPKPTPKPTQPLPSVPLPSVPLPSLPLPSLPLPLPSVGGPTSSPMPEATDNGPRPSPTDPAEAPGNETGSGTPGSPGSPGSASTPGTPGGTGSGSVPGGSAPGSDNGPVAAGEPPDSRLVYDPDRLDLQTGSFGILSGFGVWAVPAATIGLPGLFVLLWVALQVGGGLAWIPAVRRLRGNEKRYVT